MFSGIIEATGKIIKISAKGTNKSFFIESNLATELKVDQSIAHNGCCLTVEGIDENSYCVTAIEETLLKTNLGSLKEGDQVNLERCISLGTRLDGHIVQGHVDGIAKCIKVENHEGSYTYTFEYPEEFRALLVEKGSICVNGVSLTAFDCDSNHFTVAIIPYTFKYTNFSSLQSGDTVNLEFDILGKYMQRWMEVYR